MNFAEYSINHKVVSWMFASLLLIGGVIAFFGLGQLEFPEFTIKKALVITSYPGASPEQVEEEVSLPLEDAIQQLDNIKHITSINSAGLSQIEIDLTEQVAAQDLQQIWDEVRRKVNDTTTQFPNGVLTPKIIDDFGDVYGILYNITGNGYSNRELENYADFLRRELVLVKGIKKVTIDGAIQEQVVIEISQQKLNGLGLDQNTIYALINSQNGVSNAGTMLIGENRIRLHPTGEFNTVEQLSQLLVSPPGSAKLIRLQDIADIYKAETETPTVLYHSKGEQSLSIGISFSKGVNVVKVGEMVNLRIQQLEDQRPIGIELSKVYDQSQMVSDTVDGFVLNLIISIVIVIAVLLLFMGILSGLLMGSVLLLTILGTFIVMKMLNIELQIISLGALIIALGMLVDNAIVVTEGFIIGLKRGGKRLDVAKEVITQTQWPLLGATVIAIVAFAPIGLSSNSTGEFCDSLFKVLLISLFISWVTAMTLTPFFCNLMFKDGKSTNTDEPIDPYKGWLFQTYKKVLTIAIKYRALTMLLIIGALIGSVMSFSKVKNEFFPASNTPMFYIDVWLPEGTDIKSTEKFIGKIELDLLNQQERHDLGLVNLTSVIGKGSQRFYLSYMPEKGYNAFGQLIIEMEDLSTLAVLMIKLEHSLADSYPEAEFRFKPMENGPSPAAKIEAKFYGNDPAELRKLATKAELILKSEPTATAIRHDWRNQVSLVRPQIALAQARETGINKQDLDNALLQNFSGRTIGVYREKSHMIPIVARAPEQERLDASSIWKLQIWSSENQTFVPITQVISEFNTEWENPMIMRRDRKRVISVFADPVNGIGETADSVFLKVKGKIEAIPLPAGYSLEWGGDYEVSTEAKTGVFSSIPMGYLAMFLITVLLFNSVRQPLVIWFTVPLALIGVVSGLLLFDAPFSFMALLGLLSLTGMIIKNGIVLVDQINLELTLGKVPLEAVIDSSVSRVRPVLMAAITTMLGMLPLISDAFFGSMAITIIFGLGFASVLTLIVLPVSYTLIFRMPNKI